MPSILGGATEYSTQKRLTAVFKIYNSSYVPSTIWNPRKQSEKNWSFVPICCLNLVSITSLYVKVTHASLCSYYFSYDSLDFATHFSHSSSCVNDFLRLRLTTLHLFSLFFSFSVVLWLPRPLFAFSSFPFFTDNEINSHDAPLFQTKNHTGDQQCVCLSSNLARIWNQSHPIIWQKIQNFCYIPEYYQCNK